MQIDKSSAIHGFFVTALVNELDKAKKKTGYSKHENKLSRLLADYDKSKAKQEYEFILFRIEEYTAIYGEAIYEMALAKAREKNNQHLMLIKNARAKLIQVDNKVAGIIQAKFDFAKLTTVFGGMDIFEQYNEGLITFVEFCNAFIMLVAFDKTTGKKD